MSNMVNVRNGLAGWDYTVDLSEWFDPTVSFLDARVGIATALRDSGWNSAHHPEHPDGITLSEICDMMEGSRIHSHFDTMLGWVYDMADRDHVHIVTTNPHTVTHV